MTLEEFIKKYKGRAAEFEGIYPNQCMDLIEFYNRDVIGAPRLGGNAKDLISNPRPNFYEYKYNYPWYIPPRGSIAVWNGNVGKGFGHTAIVLEANLLAFKSLDQNWPVGAIVTETDHNYFNVQGFLVPRPLDIRIVYNTLVDDMRSLINKYPRLA